MSDFVTPRLAEEDSQSSDERMDTGSESFKSQDTPNSVLSSDFEDRSIDNVLRLQNPNCDIEGHNCESRIPGAEIKNSVLRLARPERNDNRADNVDLSDSFINRMSHLDINSDAITESSQINDHQVDNQFDGRPKNLSLIKNSSNLVLTTSHPLMGPESPDYPDVVPKMAKDDDREFYSLDEDNMYSLESNTSKNNLYFSENFVTADSMAVSESNFECSLTGAPPDVARVEQTERRKIVARLSETPKKYDTESPQRVLGRVVTGARDDSKCAEDGGRRCDHSTPKVGVTAPALQRNDLDSPDVISSSTEEKSLYQAVVDANTGRVSLAHRPRRTSLSRELTPQRRKIQLPPEDDQCSLDSVSVSMDSEEEPPELEPPDRNESCERNGLSDHDERSERSDRNDLECSNASDDDVKRSKSSSTSSQRSEPIPEYSAADERRDLRSWLPVRSGGAVHSCDVKVIEPFKRALSHGGYAPCGAALIVLRACHLPHQGRPDYRYVMDNLFLYMMWTLERLVTEEYILVVLHAGAQLPGPRYLQRWYLLVDRRLRKSLKQLYLVHPTFWLRSLVLLTKPFVSSKFFRKLNYVYSLDELTKLVPVDPNTIPDVVRSYDARR